MTNLRIAWIPHSTNPAYAGVRLRWLLPRAMLRRAGVCVTAPAGRDDRTPSAVVVQGKWLLDAGTAPSLVSRMEWLRSIKHKGSKLVLDSFDNYFLNEGSDGRRASLLSAYRQCLGAFDAYVVSSPGLVPFMREEVGDAPRVLVVGDPVEGRETHRLYESPLRRAGPGRWLGHVGAALDRLRLTAEKGGPMRLIWFGNHGSKYASGGMDELGRIAPFVEAAAADVPVHLTVVSNSKSRYLEVLGQSRFSHSYRQWDRIHFAGFLAQQDLALLPASPTSFNLAKSNNRLLLPLSMGVPVIADALPDYLPWQDHFCLGQWDRLADVLRDIASLRRRAVAAAPRILQQYSPRAIGDAWHAALVSLL